MILYKYRGFSNFEFAVDIFVNKVKIDKTTSIYIISYEKDTGTILGLVNLSEKNGGNKIIGFNISRFELDENTSDLSSLFQFFEPTSVN